MSKKTTSQSSSSSQFKMDGRMNRHFSEVFKRQRVSEILSKKVKIHEVCKLYSVSRASVYRWLYRYSDVEKSTQVVVQMESEASKTAYYRARLAEMERLYGQKQIEVEYLNKAFELASEEVGYDLKKKYAQPLLNGIVPTDPNTPTQ